MVPHKNTKLYLISLKKYLPKKTKVSFNLRHGKGASGESFVLLGHVICIDIPDENESLFSHSKR